MHGGVRNDLVLKHTGLAKSFAISAARAYRLSPDDLIQESMVALLIAAERFDPARNVKFTTFAYWQIRSHITAVIRRERRHTHVNSRRSTGSTPIVTLDQVPEGNDTTLLETLPSDAPSPEALQEHAQLQDAWKLALKAAAKAKTRRRHRDVLQMARAML